MKLKATLTQFQTWGSGVRTAAAFLNTPLSLNQNPSLKVRFLVPPQDSCNGQALPRTSLFPPFPFLPVRFGFQLLTVCKHCSPIHLSCTFLWPDGFSKNIIALFRSQVYSWKTFPAALFPSFNQPGLLIPKPSPRSTNTTNQYTR